jgi:hypothetical protein
MLYRGDQSGTESRPRITSKSSFRSRGLTLLVIRPHIIQLSVLSVVCGLLSNSQPESRVTGRTIDQ